MVIDMPYGYTNCRYCGKQVSSRSLAKHLEICKTQDIIPTPVQKKKPEPVVKSEYTPKSAKGWIKNHSAGSPLIQPDWQNPNPPFSNQLENGEKTKLKATRNNPYNIAISFIKNSIIDGSLQLNISQLISDGRATMILRKQVMTITVDLAKFRHNLNKV